VSLDLVDLVHFQSTSGLVLSDLVNYDRTWFVLFASSCEKSFTIVSHANL